MQGESGFPIASRIPAPNGMEPRMGQDSTQESFRNKTPQDEPYVRVAMDHVNARGDRYGPAGKTHSTIESANYTLRPTNGNDRRKRKLSLITASRIQAKLWLPFEIPVEAAIQFS